MPCPLEKREAEGRLFLQSQALEVAAGGPSSPAGKLRVTVRPQWVTGAEPVHSPGISEQCALGTFELTFPLLKAWLVRLPAP